MISTVSDLLHQLQEKEKKALHSFGAVGHQGMIGDMFEGQTRKLLDYALFDGLDLRVVEGKVKFDEASYSRQIDAMIVRGDAERMPNTEHFLYPPSQVIAVIEVKKTLYGTALDDAYQNLRSVHSESFLKGVSASSLRYAYRKVAQSELPKDLDMSKLSWERGMQAKALMWDVALPIRIVFGYDGFRNEATLRAGLIAYLEKVVESGTSSGYAPANFPSLIICGNSSLVKLNGMPFSAQSEDPHEWPLIASYGRSPLTLLLEVIWTRLSMARLIGTSVFGEDLNIEQLNPLLFAGPIRIGEKGGWNYTWTTFTKAQLSSASSTRAWEPTRLTDNEAVLVQHLCTHIEIDTRTSQLWSEWSTHYDGDIDEFLERLRYDGLAARNEHGVITLLTEQCTIAALPDGSFVAGDNNNGRLKRWILARIGEPLR